MWKINFQLNVLDWLLDKYGFVNKRDEDFDQKALLFR